MGVKFSIIIFSIIFINGYNCDPLIQLKSNSSLEIKSKVSSYLGYCSSDYSCGLNQVCVDYRCQCDYNYYYSSLSCIYRECSLDYQCQSYDSHRVCNYGSCICESGYSTDYSNGHKCRYSYSYSGTSLIWVWMVLPFTTCVIIAVVIYYIYRRRRNLNHGYHTNAIVAYQIPQNYGQNTVVYNY